MSGGATIRAPDRDLRPVAIRPIVGNMSTSRNQGLALLMLFKETMKEGRGEEAAFSMEEMALSQKNTSKAYWVIKLTPKNVDNNAPRYRGTSATHMHEPTGACRECYASVAAGAATQYPT